MDTSTIGHNRPVSQRLHPFVYKAIFALAVVFLLGVWEFAGDEYTGYLIAVVAGLVFVALALPFVLWRIRRSHRRRGRAEESDAPEKEDLRRLGGRRFPRLARSREGRQRSGRGPLADRRGRLRHGRLQHRLEFHLSLTSPAGTGRSEPAGEDRVSEAGIAFEGWCCPPHPDRRLRCVPTSPCGSLRER